MMKFGQKLLAAVLSGVLALTMLTACEGMDVPTMPEEEAKEVVFNGVNQTFRKVGKPEVQEDEQLDQLAEQYLEALRKYGTNYYGGDLSWARENLKSETGKLQINGRKIKFAALRSRTNQGRKTPLTNWDNYAFAQISEPMDYVGIAVGDVSGDCIVVLWFAEDVY